MTHDHDKAGEVLASIPLSILHAYICFIPFALLILLIRLYYNPYYKLLEEVVLGYKRLLKNALLWPAGMDSYPEGNGALRRRVLKLMAKLKINPREISDEDFGSLEKQANAPVRKVTELPERVTEQGRTAVTVTSFLATLISPLIAKGADVFQVFLTGKGKGNAVLLQHNHNWDNWQANLGFAPGGNAITIRTGPVFKAGPVIIRPGIGPVIGTQDKLELKMASGRLRVLALPSADRPVQFFLLTSYKLGFTQDTKEQENWFWDASAHWVMSAIGLEKTGLGLETTGVWFPHRARAPTNPSVDWGPKLWFRLLKGFSLETYLGFNPRDKMKPAQFRLLGFISF